uniref:Histone deacetylase HDT3 n=1 Tax=Noccaea caerulescens TaxID=107243 RepID=A0A1J3GM30_NOCCA
MEFWGVEVKSGVSLPVDPGTDRLLHISHAALGEKKNNGSEPVRVYLKVGDKRLVIGTLSHEKLPQLSTEIVLEKTCELSHSWKNGSVYFSGYKVATDSEGDEPEDEPAVAQSAAKQVNFQVPNEDDNAGGSDEESSDDDTSEDSGDEEEKKVAAKVDSDDDDEDDSSDEDEDDSSDEDTPEKAEESKKRSAESNTSKNPAASNKKAKFVTPEKSTESKKAHVHVATPHPSKQGGKNSESNGESSKQQQTPKSGGAFGCKSCNRRFTSETGLQSHTKAKHSAAA